jgi:TatA/E family protein of Tat protein translocase
LLPRWQRVRVVSMLANLTGDWPWLLIVVLVVFGGSQLPKLAKNAGEAMNEFRKAHNEIADPPHTGTTSTPTLPATPVAAAVPTVVASSAPSAVPPGPASSGEELVTLTRAQLDAILGAKTVQPGPAPDGAPSGN